MCLIIAPVSWSYATGKYQLVYPDIDPQEIRLGKIMPLITLAVNTIAMGVSFLNTVASMIVFATLFISIVIILAVQGRIRTTRQAAK